MIKLRWEEEKLVLQRERSTEARELLFDGGANVEQDECIWFVDRKSSSQFTGRRLQADEVKENFDRILEPTEGGARHQHKVVVIYGLGGSGKTQFCLRYAEDNRCKYRGVFWIDGSTEENAHLSFASIGQRVGKGSSSAAGKYWVSQCQRPWLLIIDNADEYLNSEMSDFFPSDGSGHILVTTRNSRAREIATAGDIRFRGMDPEEGINLLLGSAYTKQEAQNFNSGQKTLARSLAAELGYLALALSLAGNAIRKHIYTLEHYLRVYLKYRDRLLPKSISISAIDANAFTTWEISLQKMGEQVSMKVYQDAADLIKIFAFLHFEGVHASFFRPHAALPEDVRAQYQTYPDIIRCNLSGTNPEDEALPRLRQALAHLADYSLIDYDEETETYSQHPVVHRWARDRLEGEDQRWWLRSTSLILAGSISPDMDAAGQAFRRTLVPHIDSCLLKLEHLEPFIPTSTEGADMLERFALVFGECGLWKRAQVLQKNVIKFRTEHLGWKHEDTVRAVSSLGQTYWNLFELDSAIRAQRQVLAARRGIWPSWSAFIFDPPWLPKPRSYYIAVDDLTRTLWLANERGLSKLLGTRASNALLRILGPDDPITLNAMFNLARTLYHLGEWEEAETLLRPVLRKREHFFGPRHWDTLMTRNELGMLYCAKEMHLALAKGLVTKVLEARKATLGEEHAYTLWSVNDLSRVLCERGEGAEAVKILEDIVPVVARTLGEMHVGMIMTKSNLARAYA